MWYVIWIIGIFGVVKFIVNCMKKFEEKQKV